MRRSRAWLLFWMTVSTSLSGIGTAFLSVPVSPRELALGGTSVSTLGDPSLYRGNPALIVQSVPSMEIYFNYNSWFSNVTGSSLLVIQPAFGGSAGLALRHLGVSDLELRTAVPTDGYLAQFSSSGTMLEGIWGKRFEKFGVGASVRLIRFDSYIYSSTGKSVDLGGWWQIIPERFTVGLALKQLGSMNEFIDQQPEIPLTTAAGATYLFGSGRDGSIRSSVTLGTEISANHGTVVRMAGEVSFNSSRVTIGTRLSNQVSAVAAGLNLAWRRFRIGYGVEVASHQLGIPHLFSIGFVLP
ncbi:MAG: hypothetical protein QF613_07550 [Candidatus Marinimicrobia bacterium]|nr:hypothetical protein [Candidatus Neomarinimicrobiota bacterium]MDP6594037.1 hypothetical protein [Candidatus Neomarinimicrobiota bacterium]MDP6836714.1 hypothetical protein [Candidatus Neomarinimicrobiota bacterium]